VQSFNHIPDLTRTLKKALQTFVDQEAMRLKNTLQEAVLDKAVAAPAIRQGFYVRTRKASGYGQAVQAIQALFVHPETLFPQSVQDLFTGQGTLFATTTQEVFSPRIVKELDQPAPLSASIGNATAWATQAEYGEVSAPFILKTVHDFEVDTKSFQAIWKGR
jgi:hypothetical protein